MVNSRQSLNAVVLEAQEAYLKTKLVQLFNSYSNRKFGKTVVRVGVDQ